MSPSHQRIVKPAAIGAFVLALAVGLWAFMGQGKAAPDVSFYGIKGERIETKALRGKVVMVNFWATSCATCVKEMPMMVATYNKFHAQGLEYVAVAMSYDPPNYVLNYAETRQLPFKVALDVDGKAAKAYGDVALTPTTFVIGRDGRIVKRYIGEPQEAELHAVLKKALRA